jgi:hypothetical protein
MGSGPMHLTWPNPGLTWPDPLRHLLGQTIFLKKKCGQILMYFKYLLNVTFVRGFKSLVCLSSPSLPLASMPSAPQILVSTAYHCAATYDHFQRKFYHIDHHTVLVIYHKAWYSHGRLSEEVYSRPSFRRNFLRVEGMPEE